MRRTKRRKGKPRQPKNRGLLHEPIILNKDGVFGSERSFVGNGKVIRPDGQWDEGGMVVHEHQSDENFDTMSCLSFGTANHIELYEFDAYGATSNYSDRFLAKASGTTERGNTPQKVYETARKAGFVTEDLWPWSTDVRSWPEYMSEIPARVFTLAKLWLTEKRLWHDYVNPPTPENIRAALPRSPVAVSNSLMKGEDGIYYKPAGWRDSHWAVIRGYYPNGDWKLRDTYEPFEKRVRADTTFEVAKVITITPATLEDWKQVLLSVLQAIRSSFPSFVRVAGRTVPQSLLDQLKAFVADLIAFKRKAQAPTTVSNREKLYQASLSYIGTDASPNDLAPDELGCAESVNEIHRRAFGQPIDTRNPLSTYWLLQALRTNGMFEEVSEPEEGDVVISPTGYGTRKLPSGKLVVPNGHVGILGREEQVMSSDSKTGTWKTNYTLDTWAERYVKQGGYPMRFFRRL